MLFEFTLTLMPKMYASNAMSQYNQTKNIIDLLYRTGKIRNISIVCELTQTFNVHYHCLVDLKDRKAQVELIDHFRPFKQFGKKSLNVVMNEPNYRKYMAKSLKETAEVIEACPIICDDLHVFDNEECTCPKSAKMPKCPYKICKRNQFQIEEPEEQIA